MWDALADLQKLWRTRHSSGFPLPFRWSPKAPSWHAAVKQWATGHVWYSSVPLREQMLGIPLRPYRYWRVVREVARTRNMPYSSADQDAVP